MSASGNFVKNCAGKQYNFIEIFTATYDAALQENNCGAFPF